MARPQLTAKGKGDALDRGNYRGLKLTEQAMKILERIVDGLIFKDRWCLLTTPSLALSQEEAKHMLITRVLQVDPLHS